MGELQNELNQWVAEYVIEAREIGWTDKIIKNKLTDIVRRDLAWMKQTRKQGEDCPKVYARLTACINAANSIN